MADLGHSPLSNVGLEGSAGVVEEEAHAEGCEALIRALVHIRPKVQEKVDNVIVTMHLQEDKARLVRATAGSQQRATWHWCHLSEAAPWQGGTSTHVSAW